jgi:nitrilase
MAESSMVRVAAVQIAPDLESGEGTLARVLSALAEAAGKGARLAVFPETFVPWYPYFSFIYPLSPPAPSTSGFTRMRSASLAR